MSNEEKILAMLETTHTDNGEIKQELADVVTRLDKKLQRLIELQATIIENIATKEQVDKLREDLGLERYRIDVLAELRKAK